MTNSAPLCEFCGQPSTLLCDGRIYTMPDGTERRVEVGFMNGKTNDSSTNQGRNK